MRPLRELDIDFLRYRRVWIGVSCAVLLLGLWGFFFLGKLDLGVEFTGGTQTGLRFAVPPDLERLRADLRAAGLSASLQRLGEASENSILVRVPAQAGDEEGSGGAIREAIDAAYGGERRPALNRADPGVLLELLVAADPDRVAGDAASRRAHYGAAVDSIRQARAEAGLLTGWSQLDGRAGITPAVRETLEASTVLGGFAVLSQESIGPQMGSELRRKGLLAVVLSLTGMLLYIWLRFELRYAIGAITASIHDVLVTLGLLALAGLEFDLSTIAALLTVVGYSVNDTVVVFDRVRENRRQSPHEPLERVINRSLNQTLSRTLLTSGTTLAATGSLLAFGGDALRSFSFVMTVGVVVGTYSTVYIAGPFALLWGSLRRRRGAARADSEPPVGLPGRPAAV